MEVQANRGGTMIIPDATGHTQVKWDPSRPDEVTAARAQFDAMLGQNYRAFRVEGEDRQGTRIERFDPEASRIMFVPHLRGG